MFAVPIGNLPAALVFFNVAAVWLLVMLIMGGEPAHVLLPGGIIVLAVVQIIVDIVLRVRAYRQIRLRGTIATVLTRDGWVVPPRRPVMEVLEAVLSWRCGGQTASAIPCG